MKKQLIFIGGPPGVGKSTVTNILFKNLKNSVWLDGDDVWRMSPFTVNDTTKLMVEKNVGFVLNSFVEAHFSYVLFTWALHSDSVVDSLLKKMDLSDYEFKHFTLTCDKRTLEERIHTDIGRETKLSLAIDRLNLIKTVNSEKINTAGKSPTEIAALLEDKIILQQKKKMEAGELPFRQI